MEPIRKLIPHSVKRAGIGRQVEANKVVEAAGAALRAMFAHDSERDVRPLYFKNRTLTISCSSSVFAQEIKLNEATIVQSINKLLTVPVVERIRYLL